MTAHALDPTHELPPIYVSAHALRRYFERVVGMSVSADDGAALWELRAAGVAVDAVRAEIERVVRPAVEAGAAYVECGPARFRIAGRSVVTVVPAARAGT